MSIKGVKIMCIELKGIDIEIFLENLHNPNHPSDEEIEQIRKWSKSP